jgi:hypothetical protein
MKPTLTSIAASSLLVALIPAQVGISRALSRSMMLESRGLCRAKITWLSAGGGRGDAEQCRERVACGASRDQPDGPPRKYP